MTFVRSGLGSLAPPGIPQKTISSNAEVGITKQWIDAWHCQNDHRALCGIR